jgi:hypothetical protein
MNGLPIQEAPNSGSVSQIQQLILVYNHYLDRLRDEIGVNEYREGAAINPKLGLGVQQSQIQASNNATDFIYDAYLNIYKETAFKISLLLYDSVSYGGKQYQDYLSPEAVKGKVFDVKIEVLPDDKERQFIESMIQTSLSAGIIDFEDAFKVRSIKNIKLAEMYLTKAKHNKDDREMKKAKINSEMNAQSQQQSIQAKANADMELQKAEAQVKIAIVNAELSLKKEIEEQTFIHSALMKSFELGRPLSPDLQGLVEQFFGKKQQMEQMQAMQQQMQQQGQQEEDGSQENEQEGGQEEPQQTEAE